MFATFATPSGHTGCDSYETGEKSNRYFFFYRHLYKMLAGRLPWESDDSEDEVLLLYSYAVGNKPERKWVHEVNMKRREFGEFHHLMKQLHQDEVKFKEYFRMNSNQFEKLTQQTTNYLLPAARDCMVSTAHARPQRRFKNTAANQTTRRSGYIANIA